MTGGLGQKDVGKGAIVSLPHLWHLSPSWGCCDYLVKIATVNTQAKLTMANDPLTGTESASSAVFAHIEFDTIHPQPPTPIPHPHTNTPRATITTMCSRSDSSIFLISCQKAISWGGGQGAVSYTMDACAWDSQASITGAKWWTMVSTSTWNNTAEASVGLRVPFQAEHKSLKESVFYDIKAKGQKHTKIAAVQKLLNMSTKRLISSDI